MQKSQSFLELLARLPGGRRLFWILAQRFIAGKTVENALSQAAHLNVLGFPVILDYVGENNQSLIAIKTAEEKYLAIFPLVRKRDLNAEVSLKPTQFGLEMDHYRHWLEDYPEILSVLETADQSAMRVWLDAELLETRDGLWNLVECALEKVYFLGAAFQAYGNAGFNSKHFFENRVALLARCLKKGKTLALRLCKGAYQSSEKWILRDPDEIRERYLELARSMLELVLINRAREDAGIFFPEFATHDPELINEIKLMAERLGLAKNCFRLAMLYGRQQTLASHLFTEGYTVAIYLPFGPDWLAYLSRRLRENKSYIRLPFLREGEYHLCPDWPDKCVLFKK